VNKGLKLIVAVNRDEQVDRRTIPADMWPPKLVGGRGGQTVVSVKDPIRNLVTCDQSKMEPPYNLCVYGALDMEDNTPPNYYSTWLGK
jgi:hypothetical protein